MHVASAQSDEISTPPVTAPDALTIEREPEVEVLTTIDRSRDFISEKITTYSKHLDQFFGDERYFQEHNDSVIQLDLSETLAQEGARNFGFEGKVKIDLPAASKRFQVVLESNPEQKTANEVKKDQPVAPVKEIVPANFAASLRFEHRQEDVWHFSSDAGVKLQAPLDPFTRARGSFSVPIGPWRLKIAETIFWFNRLGLGATSQLDLERILDPYLLFRATSTATCYEDPSKCDLRQDFSVFHTLSERAAWVYQASIVATNQPILQETDYVVLARYRYRLHKKWVYFELTPQLTVPRADGFRRNAQLLMRLELLLGGT
jgi:hypothetical protein